MPKIEKEVTILNAQGLHARPAALFVQISVKYDCTVTVTKGDESVNGKSIMGILMLAANKGSKVQIRAEGSDAEAAIIELERLLSGDLDDTVLKTTISLSKRTQGINGESDTGKKRI